MTSNDNQAPPDFFNEKTVCAFLGISCVTTTKWRAKAKGSPFIKVGRLVRYRRSDVDAWLHAKTIGSPTGA